MKLGVSACLIGTPCRYDGVSSSDKFVIGTLQKYFDTVAYCPETIIWGSPRTAVFHLIEKIMSKSTAFIFTDSLFKILLITFRLIYI